MTKSGIIDLHTHSTASDGSLAPGELVREAVKLGLCALALTDHDTVNGNLEAAAEAEKYRLNFIPGVEISCDFSKNILHILGFWIDFDNVNLKQTLSELVDFRTNRNLLITNRLNELGVDIAYDEVQTIAGNEVVGRPHFAQLLVKKGAAASFQDAFDRYLARGKSAYISRKRLTASEGIGLIVGAGGLPCLAHPGQYNINDTTDFKSLIAQLIDEGLQAIEVYYSDHSAEETAFYRQIAEDYNLAISAGSDFHGQAKPGVKLGSGRNGNLNIGVEVLEKLQARHSQTYGLYSNRQVIR